jgi:hypothetical protein
VDVEASPFGFVVAASTSDPGAGVSLAEEVPVEQWKSCVRRAAEHTNQAMRFMVRRS